MPRVKFGAFLAPHHPIGEHPMFSNSSAKFEYTLFGLRVSEM
jgi:hypothetical protein